MAVFSVFMENHVLTCAYRMGTVDTMDGSACLVHVRYPIRAPREPSKPNSDTNSRYTEAADLLNPRGLSRSHWSLVRILNGPSDREPKTAPPKYVALSFSLIGERVFEESFQRTPLTQHRIEAELIQPFNMTSEKAASWSFDIQRHHSL